MLSCSRNRSGYFRYARIALAKERMLKYDLVKNHTIVIKIGTTSITKGCDKGVNLDVISQLANAAAELKKNNFQVTIVSSGAMGLGVAKLGREKLEEQLNQDPCDNPSMTIYKQALTSVGQVELMNAYQAAHEKLGLHVGQVLVTHAGLDDTHRNETIKTTIEKMFELNLIPVINANDTVTSSEIEYGDNDSLSARIATLLGAEKLFILSDVDGLYDKDPNKNPDAKLLSEVKDIDGYVKSIAGESASGSGLGGMKSKIDAVELCMSKGIESYILKNTQIAEIPSLVLGTSGNNIGTRFIVSLRERA